MRCTTGAVLAIFSALLFSAAARADDVAGLLDGGFAYGRARAGGVSDSDQYTGHGALLYTLDNPGFAFQLDGSGDFYFAIPHSPAHLWSAEASAFWRDAKGTFGVSGSYFSVDAPAAPIFRLAKSIESYGFFGEYYVFKDLTLQIRGGGTTGEFGLASYDGAGGLTYYDSPDLAFHTEYNFTAFTSGHDWTDVNSSVEYLPFSRTPVSLYAGYDYTNVSHGGDLSTLFVGVKYRFGAARALSDYQRSGPIEWTGSARPGANLKF